MIVDTQTALPGFVQIEPVGQCNLRCRMCPVQFRADHDAHGAPAFIEYETFCRLIDQFDGMTELQLQGMGEPLLHPRFFDMVAYAAQRGIEVSTNTNLTILTERRAYECVASGLRRMHVSLDGASAETYEYIRVQARFEQVLRNLRRLLAIKREKHSEFPNVSLVMVLMRRNLAELPDLIRLAHDIGVDALSVQRLCHDFSESTLPEKYKPMRAFVQMESLPEEDVAYVEEVFDTARRLANELTIDVRLPNVRPRRYPERVSGRRRCDWPWRGAYVSFAGDAMPCCMVATPDRINFGNMARDGVAEIWNNDAYAEFRERLDSDDPPAICRGCAVYAGTF